MVLVPLAGLPGGWEIVLIILALVLLFGASAIPKLARSLGKAQGEFQKARKELKTELDEGRREVEAGPDEAQIRASARDLGIEEEGKSLDEVKAAINAKLS